MPQDGSLRLDIDATAFQPVLQELKFIDRELYKATEKGLKDAALPLVLKVKSALPATTVSGLMRKHEAMPKLRKKGGRKPYPVYSAGNAKRGVVSKVGGRKRTDAETFPVLRIQQKQGAAMIYDMAQKDHTSTLARNLSAKHGKDASRTMYPVVRANIGIIENDLRAEISKAEKIVSNKIAIAGGKSQYKASSGRASAQARNLIGRFVKT